MMLGLLSCSSSLVEELEIVDLAEQIVNKLTPEFWEFVWGIMVVIRVQKCPAGGFPRSPDFRVCPDIFGFPPDLSTPPPYIAPRCIHAISTLLNTSMVLFYQDLS